MSSILFHQPYQKSARFYEEQIDGPRLFNCSTTIDKAMKSMASVYLPLNTIDIFNRKIIDLAKTLFSEERQKDPSPGFEFGNIESHYVYTLESYFVDKHLSNNVSTEFIREALQIMRQTFEKELKTHPVERLKARERVSYFTKVLFKHFPKNQQNQTDFMRRLILRAYRLEEAKLPDEFPLPKFSEEKTYLTIKKNREKFEFPSMTLIELNTSEDKKLLEDYCIQIFDERDKRILKMFEDAFAKDEKVKVKDSKANWTHLTTLEPYEIEISSQRKRLYLMISMLVGIFFFSSLTDTKSKLSNLMSLSSNFHSKTMSHFFKNIYSYCGGFLSLISIYINGKKEKTDPSQPMNYPNRRGEDRYMRMHFQRY